MVGLDEGELALSRPDPYHLDITHFYSIISSESRFDSTPISHMYAGTNLLAISPPGGNFWSKLKNREEFEGGLYEKRQGKWRKEE